MAFSQIDPASLEGDDLRRWYLRSPADIEEEQQQAAVQRYQDFFGGSLSIEFDPNDSHGSEPDDQGADPGSPPDSTSQDPDPGFTWVPAGPNRFRSVPTPYALEELSSQSNGSTVSTGFVPGRGSARAYDRGILAPVNARPEQPSSGGLVSHAPSSNAIPQGPRADASSPDFLSPHRGGLTACGPAFTVRPPIKSASAGPQRLQIEKPSAVSQQAWNALLQANAAVRGAANIFGGDQFAAGMDALVSGGFAHWRDRYEANLAEEHARDRYDASHRAPAQAIGQVGGTALGLALVGPAEGSVALSPRLAGAATLTGRETAALLGAGAGTGLAMQTASDIAAGGRRSSNGDKAGAALGGAASVAALPLGPARAGAVGGWITSASQDAFNGRPISLERAGQSAVAGNILGSMAGNVGARISNDLPMAAKGRLGEAMGDVRSTIDGERRLWAPKSRDYLDEDTYWYPDARDARTLRQRPEDKFGYGVKLSPNQAQAQSKLGPHFRLNHFTPGDIGRLLSLPTGPAGAQLVRPDDRYWY